MKLRLPSRKILSPYQLLGFAAVFLLLLPGWLTAQDFTGFRGLVTDPTNAAIPGAEVKATEEQAGLTHSTVTNDAGDYELRGLLPGTYTIEISLSGFKTYQNKGVIVYARQVRRVDAKLEIGQVAETVTVQAEGSVLQTDTGSITYKTGDKEMYGLNIQSWLVYRIDLNPGAESRSQVHGSFANNTNAEQDGISTNAYGSWRAPQETTQEIHQISLNAPAEYRTSTSVIGVGKKGTNDWHGEVFANYTHPALNALAFGQTSRPPSTPTIRWSWEASVRSSFRSSTTERIGLSFISSTSRSREGARCFTGTSSSRPRGCAPETCQSMLPSLELQSEIPTRSNRSRTT